MIYTMTLRLSARAHRALHALIMILPITLITSSCLAEDQSPPPPKVKILKKLQQALSKGDTDLKRASKKLLSPLEYRVAFQSGTERAFANRYWNNEETGLYVDLISGKPLFSSAHKFKSGSGWPSFDRALGVEVVEVVDESHGMRRVEVRSKTSGIHLGHVFEDGPRATTRRRFCINSASLVFIPRDQLVARGYKEWIERAGL